MGRVAPASGPSGSQVRRSLSVGAAVILGLGACSKAPSRAETLVALERSPLSHDTATVYRRVWADGPPWFSCAEVIAKFDGHADTAAVRDQVGNWRPLVVAGWLVLRDTSFGVVSEPGWCSAHLTDQARSQMRGWIAVERDTFPTGRRRRGWTVPIGHQRITVAGRPVLHAGDTASVAYALSVAVNGNGAAMKANLDTLKRVATLVRRDDGWHVTEVHDAPGGRKP